MVDKGTAGSLVSELSKLSTLGGGRRRDEDSDSDRYDRCVLCVCVCVCTCFI
jgi:hypothetical protein